MLYIISGLMLWGEHHCLLPATGKADGQKEVREQTLKLVVGSARTEAGLQPLSQVHSHYADTDFRSSFSLGKEKGAGN